MKIGILKTDTVNPALSPDFGEYPDMFQRLLHQVDPSLEFVTYDIESGEFPTNLDAVDAFLITGSKSSVYEDKPWIRELEEFVRKLDSARARLVGICFGHQMVAQALGGATRKADVGWGVGVHSADWLEKPAWAGDPASFRLLVSHQDQVLEAAPGTRVLAGSDFCPNAVCQIGDHILTFQGHPEFIHDYSRSLLELRREQIGEEVYHKGVESLSQDTDHLSVARWIIDFMKG